MTFAPEKGMNLLSLKKDKLELIDQSTTDLFEERCAGLGALIGPHFYQKKESLLPPPPPMTLFPHLPKILAKGQKDFFSHGIGRYVPWQFQAEEAKIVAKLTSVDLFKGIPLSDLEGSNFYLTYEAEILDDRIRIKISSNSDTESLIGLHYYYQMKSPSAVHGNIDPFYYEKGEKKELPKEWLNDQKELFIPIDSEIDYGFHPKLENGKGTLSLKTKEYELRFEIVPEDQSEFSIQVYHPKESSFVCIEPISAANPRGKIPKKGSLTIDLFITLFQDQTD